jgi:hypothetical protein
VITRTRFGLIVLATLLICLPACAGAPSSSDTGGTSPIVSQTSETGAQALDDYLKSLSNADYDRAYLLQSKQAQAGLSLDDFRQITRLSWEQMMISGQAWKVLSETPSGPDLLVAAEITTTFQTGNQVTKRALYTLVREGGEWRIDRVMEIKPSSP